MFENFVHSLYKGKNGTYLGPDKFNEIRQPTEEDIAKNKTSPAFNTMNLFLLKSLAETTHRTRWLEAAEQGYDFLIRQLEQKGPNHFINTDAEDENFTAGKGGIFWDAIVKYMKHIGSAGFKTLLDRIDNLPKQVTEEEITNKRLLWL